MVAILSADLHPRVQLSIISRIIMRLLRAVYKESIARNFHSSCL